MNERELAKNNSENQEPVIDGGFLARFKQNVTKLRAKQKEAGTRESSTSYSYEESAATPGAPARRKYEAAEERGKKEGRPTAKKRRRDEEGGEEQGAEARQKRFMPSAEVINRFNEGLEAYALPSALWEGVTESGDASEANILLLEVIANLEKKAEVIIGEAEAMEEAERHKFNEAHAGGAATRQRKPEGDYKSYGGTTLREVVREKRDNKDKRERNAANKVSRRIMSYVYDLRIQGLFNTYGGMRKTFDEKVDGIEKAARSADPRAALAELRNKRWITEEEYEKMLRGPQREGGERESEAYNNFLDSIEEKYAQGSMGEEDYLQITNGKPAEAIDAALAAGYISESEYGNIKGAIEEKVGASAAPAREKRTQRQEIKHVANDTARNLLRKLEEALENKTISPTDSARLTTIVEELGDSDNFMEELGKIKSGKHPEGKTVGSKDYKFLRKLASE